MKCDFVANKNMLENGEFVWMLKSVYLKGCVAQGYTLEDAIAQLEANENIWIETAGLYKIAIPEELE